jgi:hypothetical protein
VRAFDGLEPSRQRVHLFEDRHPLSLALAFGTNGCGNVCHGGLRKSENRFCKPYRAALQAATLQRARTQQRLVFAGIFLCLRPVLLAPRQWTYV